MAQKTFADKAYVDTEVAKKANKEHGTHLTLGTTSSTAYRGDYGNTAYKHSQAAHAPSNAQKNSDITKAEIEAKLTGTITSHNHSGAYAPATHGNHVPATQAAQNTTFLRNDNTWYNLTLADLGAAAETHGTHVTFGTTAPKVAGTASVGTASTVSRSDHVHPAQTDISGNAGSATKLKNTRNIVIGNKTNSFDGSANITYTLNDIGAAPGSTSTATTAATAQWYRVAQTAAGMNRNLGIFTIENTVSGKHSITQLNVGVNYGLNPTIQQLAHSDYSTAGITKARIVYHTSYNNNYAYLEVYQAAATAATMNVVLSNNIGWTLVTPNTVGSIPSGYTSKEITLVNNKIVANIQGNVSGSSGSCTGNAATATKATQDSAGQQINTTYIKGLSVSGKTITYTKGDGTTGTITTQDTNTTYTADTGIKLNGTKFQHTNSVTAGTAQGDANKTLSWGGTFTIPTVTYDAQGHITGKGTTTMTMPSNPNSDTKVTNTLNTTAKAYITGTTSASTNTGTQVFDTGVYLDTTAGVLTAGTFKGKLTGNADSATKATQDSAGQQINTTYIKALSVSGKTITNTKGDGTTGTITTQDTNTDTHHQAKNIVGASTTATANATSSNGSTYLNLIENGAVRSTHKITGSGATTVTSDSNGNITISSTNTTYSAATTSANGLMTSAMVTKLNGIAEGANKYTHPSYTAKSSGFYKVTVDASGHVSATTAVAKADIEGVLTGAVTSHTHSYIPMAGNTGAYSVTGNVEFASPANNTFRGVVGKCGVNDYWRVGGTSTADNAGYMELATADDNNEPIYVRQYSGAYATLNRTATLLDANGNTSFPGSVTTGNKVTMQYNSTSESLDFIFI